MRKVFTSICAVAMLCCVSLAQEPSAPASSATPQPQQNQTTAPEPQSTPEASPAPSTAQPPQSQLPDQTPQTSQQTPQTTQPAPQNAQPATGNSTQASGPARIAPGSVIPVQLTKSIDAKKAKTGDEVVARVTMDLKTNSGEVVVPKDTKVVGHVTEAQARSKEQKDSQVGIIFDRAVTKSGEMQMPMSIQAIIAPQNSDSGNANNEQTPTAPSAGAGGNPSGGGGRNPGMGGTPPPAPSASTGGNTQSDTQSGAAAHQPITGNTQGVVGFKDLKLDTVAPSQGSVVSSEKNNVKLDSGTFMLLRVNQ